MASFNGSFVPQGPKDTDRTEALAALLVLTWFVLFIGRHGGCV